MRNRPAIALAVLLSMLSTELRGQNASGFDLFGQGAYSRDFMDVFSGGKNLASLAEMTDFSAGAYLLQRFSMRELRESHLFLALPVDFGTFGVQANLSGYEHYRRQQIEIAYSRKLFDWMDLGAGMDFVRMRIAGYGSAGVVTFSFSSLFRLSEKVNAGFQVFNPHEKRYHKLGNDKLPAAYQLGMGFQPSEIFLFTAEMRYADHRTEALFGFQYRILELLSIQAGAGTGENSVFGSVRFHLKHFHLLVSTSFHDRLGATPGTGFIYTDD